MYASTRSVLRSRSLLDKVSAAVCSVHAHTAQVRRLGRGLDEMENKEVLKQRLTPLQYHVTQEAGTERPFTGCYNKCYSAGTYVCIVCKQELFSSQTKFDSGCGWPAFSDVLAREKVTLHKDTSSVGGNILLILTRPGLVRTEVRCSACAAHLGHVFEDGPPPTRKRFCINSASLDFISGQDS